MEYHKDAPFDPRTFDWNAVYSGQGSHLEPADPLIVQIARDLPPGRSLDVGCGTGGLVCHLAERGWRASGVDIASNAIATARSAAARLGLEADFSVGDAATWRPNGTFDLITCTFALPGVEADQRRALAMMVDSLAPGGRVLIKDFDPSMKHVSHFSGWHLPSIDELRRSFPGFEVLRAEVVETPVHDHDGSGAFEGQRWTAALFDGRKPA